MALLDVAHRRVALEVVRFWAVGEAIPKHWEDDTISPQKVIFVPSNVWNLAPSPQHPPTLYLHCIAQRLHKAWCKTLAKSGHKLSKRRYWNPLCQNHLLLRVSAFNLPFAGGHLDELRKQAISAHMWDDPQRSLTVLSALGLQRLCHIISSRIIVSCHCPHPPFPIASNAMALWPRDFGVWQCQNRRNQHIDRSSATRASCRNPSTKGLQPGCQLITTCPYLDIAIHFHVCPLNTLKSETALYTVVWFNQHHPATSLQPHPLPKRLPLSSTCLARSAIFQHHAVTSVPTSPTHHTPHASNLASLGTRKNGSFDCSGLGRSFAWSWSGGHEVVRMISKERYLVIVYQDVKDVYIVWSLII